VQSFFRASQARNIDSNLFCKTTNVAASSTSISLTEIWATWTAWSSKLFQILYLEQTIGQLLQANFTTAASALSWNSDILYQ
jgi:hypothetical protein